MHKRAHTSLNMAQQQLTKQELKSPTLASNQSLFKGEKMTEPLKPPAIAAAYYVMTHHSELGNLTHAEIDVLWGKVPKKQKKKCIEEHKKKHQDYVYEFEKFIRTLNPAELRSFRKFMKNRARDQEEEDKESSDEESEDSESIISNEDQTSGACCDDEASETSKKTVKPIFATLKSPERRSLEHQDIETEQDSEVEPSQPTSSNEDQKS